MPSAAAKIFTNMADIIVSAQLKLDSSSAMTAIRSMSLAIDDVFNKSVKSVSNFGTAFDTATLRANARVADLKSGLASMIALGKGNTQEADAFRDKLEQSTSQVNKLSTAMQRVEAELSAAAQSAVKLTPSEAFTKSLEDAKNNTEQLKLELAQVILAQTKSNEAFKQAAVNLKAANDEVKVFEADLEKAAKNAVFKPSDEFVKSLDDAKKNVESLEQKLISVKLVNEKYNQAYHLGSIALKEAAAQVDSFGVKLANARGKDPLFQPDEKFLQAYDDAIVKAVKLEQELGKIKLLQEVSNQEYNETVANIEAAANEVGKLEAELAQAAKEFKFTPNPAFVKAYEDAQANAKKLKLELEQIEVTLGKDNEAFAQGSAKLKAATQEADKLETALTAAANEAKELTPSEAFTKSLEDAKNKATKLEQELAHIGVTQGTTSKAYLQGVANLKAANAEAQKLEGAIKGAAQAGTGGAGGLFGGLKDSFAKAREESSSSTGIFGEMAGKLGSLASPMGLATAGTELLVSGLKTVFDVGQKFETALTSIGAKTGVSGAALDNIGEQAQTMAAKFGGSASDQLTTFQDIVSEFGAGIAKTPDDLARVSDSVNTFAKASGTDAKTALGTLSSTMQQFGVDTKNANDVANLSPRFMNAMAAAAKTGGADIAQIGEAMKSAGDSMHNANLSFEEGNAAIQVLGTGGKTGAEAGKELKGVLDRISGQEVIPKEGLASLKSMGVDIKKVTDTSLPLEERLKELSKASGDATAFTKVFGKENADAAEILANGAGKVGSFTKEITGTSAATDGAAKNMNTLAARIDAGKSILENFAVDIFQVLGPIVSNVMGVLFDAFSVVKETLGPIFTQLGGTLGDVFTRVGSVIMPILAFIGGAIIGNIVTQLSFAATIATAFYDTAVKVFDGIVEALQPLVDAFKSAFNITDDVTATFDPLQLFQDILGHITSAAEIFGDILSSVGNLIATIVIEAFKNVVAVGQVLFEGIKKLVGMFSSGKKEIGDTGSAVEKAGGFFSKLSDIVQSVPHYITAASEAFKAFMGTIRDVVVNFDWGKVGDILSGKIFKDAAANAGKSFNSTLANSINTDALKNKIIAAKKEIDEELKLISTTVGNANSKSYEGDIDTVIKALNISKENLKKTLTKDLSENLLSENEVEEYVKKIDAINVTLTNKNKNTPPPNKSKLAPTAPSKAIDPLAAIEETRKAEEAKARLTIANETKLAQRLIQINSDAEEEKVTLKINAVKKSDEELSKLSEDDRKKYEDNISELENTREAIKTVSRIRIAAEDGKVRQKEFESKQKNNEEILKSEAQNSKQLVELIEKRVSATTEDERLRLDELNVAKIDSIKKNSAQELEEIISKNTKVVKAEDDLKAALASGDDERIKQVQTVYDTIRGEVEKNDKLVIAQQKKTNDAINDLHIEAAFSKRAFEISLIPDTAERVRKERLLEIDKTFAKELAAAQGNERLKNLAVEKAADARKEIEEDAARNSENLGERIEQVSKDVANGFYKNVKASFAPANEAFSSLESKFNEFAETVAQSNEEISKNSKEEYEKTTEMALDQLKKRQISYEEYIRIVDEASKKSGNSQIGIGDKVAAAMGKSFVATGKNAQKNMSATFDTIGERLKKNKFQFESVGEGVKSFFNDAGSVVDDVAISSASSLGALAVSGQLTMETAKQATLGIAFDAVSGLIMTYAPAILASAVSFLGPIFGPIASGALLAVVQGLLSAAKGAMGFKTGGYTGDGARDEAAGVVHKGEGVLEQPIMRGQVREFLELRSLLQNGISIREVLGTYKESKNTLNELSMKEVFMSNNLSVAPNGALVVTPPPMPLLQSMTTEGVYIRALERQTAELRSDNEAIKAELVKNRTTLRQIESTVNIAPVTLKANGDDLQAVMQKKMKYRMNYGG